MVIAGQHKHKTLRNPSLHEHSLFWLALPLCLLFGWWFSCLPLPLGNNNTYQCQKIVRRKQEKGKPENFDPCDIMNYLRFHTDVGILDLHFLNFLGLKCKEESSVQNFTHSIPNKSMFAKKTTNLYYREVSKEDFFTISFHDSFQITIPFVWAVNGQTAWRLTVSLRPWIVEVKKGLRIKCCKKKSKLLLCLKPSATEKTWAL